MWVSWESDVITVISYSPLGDCTVSHIPLYKGSVNGISAVVYDEVPNPCYNEYICYISPLLCLHGQKLQQSGPPTPQYFRNNNLKAGSGNLGPGILKPETRLSQLGLARSCIS